MVSASFASESDVTVGGREMGSLSAPAISGDAPGDAVWSVLRRVAAAGPYDDGS